MRERLLYGWPEMGGCRQACVIPEHAQRATPVPGFAEFLHDGLQRRRNLLVLAVAIGNQGVVEGHGGIVDPEMAKSWQRWRMTKV